MSNTCFDPEQIPCGPMGCFDSTGCCLPVSTAWKCPVRSACYTHTGTVECYHISSEVPATVSTCRDYADVPCTDGSCFRCSNSNTPSCKATVYSTADTELTITYCGKDNVVTTVGGPLMFTTGAPDYDTMSRGPSGFHGPTTTRVRSAIGSPTATIGQPPAPPPALSSGAIAGIVIGSCAVLVFAAGVYFLFWRERRESAAVARENHGIEFQAGVGQGPRPGLGY